jgi:CDP-Glycerol:Poly(glycerophosphate) glycerophosphotransferase
VHQKIRDVRFFDRTMLYERIVWVPFGTVRVVLNGHDLDMRTSEPPPPEHRLTPAMIRKGLGLGTQEAKEPEGGLSVADRAVIRLARTKLVRKYFGDAWVLIDRVFNADDSGEHLFRYLRRDRRHINAWFVIEAGTPDHRRLRREGYRRVVPHGSLAWKLLMLNCSHLIFSHADEVVVRPLAIRRLCEPRWRLIFLQHGVIKDDLSTWLNRKDLDIFVTSTRAELESIVGDHTTYRYTTREAKLTGLPRFDRVLEEGNRFPPERRDLIVIAPTWRNWLSKADTVVTGRHRVQPEDFQRSQFATEWTSLVNSEELRELAERTGLTVALLMHPNFQETGRLDTLPHVQRLHFEGQNVQEFFARARVLVTDYSSMFFNAAYIERPVVYFQFDRDRINAGWHAGRRGYFDYERDGYGPVTLTHEEAIAAITKTVESGPEPDPVYLDRIRASFPVRDGRCCERVADVIVSSSRPAGSAPHEPAAGPAFGPGGRLIQWAARAPRPRRRNPPVEG